MTDIRSLICKQFQIFNIHELRNVIEIADVKKDNMDYLHSCSPPLIFQHAAQTIITCHLLLQPLFEHKNENQLYWPGMYTNKEFDSGLTLFSIVDVKY